MKWTRNPLATEMRCIRCHQAWPFETHDYVEGCPACLGEGWPASVKVSYQPLPLPLTEESLRSWLIFDSPSLLGEGNTPLIELPELATDIGASKLFVKNEAANPTGSHKDRMAALLVQRAREIGAKTIAVASSGNAGTAIAAYASHAGLHCVVVTTPAISPNWRRAIEMHGAELIATPSGDDRWKLVARKVRSGEWYAATNYLLPPVGSNPIGVDGYRAIAFELFLQMRDNPPTDVVVPTARGDLIWGIAEGFVNLRDAGLLPTLPRVHAAEPFSRIERALEDGDYRTLRDGQTAMVSIGGPTVSYQSVEALRMTNGTPISVDDRQVTSDQRTLARAGVYLELSSVASLSAARLLAKQDNESARVIVCVGTSHGYKEPAYFDEPIELCTELS